MQRGDIVTVSAPGDYGKPRPAVVIQGDILNQSNPRSTIVALMTSAIVDAPLLRLTVRPAPGNGLKKVSQVQSNRILTLPTEKIGFGFWNGSLRYSPKIRHSRPVPRPSTA